MSGSNGRAERRRKQLRGHYGRNVYTGGLASNWRPDNETAGAHYKVDDESNLAARRLARHKRGIVQAYNRWRGGDR